MPICIECRHPVQQLYTSYSRADDRSSGKGVRLTQCPACSRFADKYVEHDFVVLFIDLVLIKPQVYRHLLFNRLATERNEFPRSIVRLAVLLLLFDVYLTWTRIERSVAEDALSGSPVSSNADESGSVLLRMFALQWWSRPERSSVLTYALPLQYLFFLVLCAVETAAFHFPVRFLTSCAWFRPTEETGSQSSTKSASREADKGLDVPVEDSTDAAGETSAVGSSMWYPYPNRISTALLVSSCSKLFPVLMVIWEYDLPSSASALNWAVIINNIAALEILVDCGYLRATLMVGMGAFCRWIVSDLILAAGGLAGYGSDIDMGLLQLTSMDPSRLGELASAARQELGRLLRIV